MAEVRNITKGYFNGKQVKFFEPWNLVDGALIFDSNHKAPAKIANKDLIDWVKENNNEI